MIEAIRLGIGLFFIAAGVSKMLRRRSVQLAVERYRLLPASMVGHASRLLGPAEILVGAGLALSPWWPPAGVAWVGATGLLVLFSLAIASALVRGLAIPCGCGGILGDHAISPSVLARNIVLLTVLSLAR